MFAFRDAERQPGVREEEEDPTCITKYWTGRIAKMLPSDGTGVNADSHTPGEDGFVHALWTRPQSRLVLDVPNRRLLNGKIVDEAPLAPPVRAKPVLKRPASALGGISTP